MATYRLFNKAKANIKKIEDEGMFGVGIRVTMFVTYKSLSY